MSKPRFAVRQLANGQSFVRRLAEGDAVAPDETVTDTPPQEMVPDATTLPALDESQFSAIEPLVNDILSMAKPGLTLPQGTTGENLIANLTNVLAVVKQLDGGGEESEPAEALPAETPIEQMSPEAMQLAIKQYRAKEAAQKAEEEKQKQLAIQKAEMDFRTRLASLCSSSKVLPVDRDEVIETGRARQWSMSILDILDKREPVLTTQSKTRQFAASGGGDKPMTSAADIRAAARQAAGIPQTAAK